LLICAAQHLNEDPTLPVNAENTIVVYLVFPFEVTDHHSVLLYTCLTAMWEVLKRKSPPPTVKVVLQPLFIEHILRSTLSPDLIRALAFSVYTKIRRIPLRERHLVLFNLLRYHSVHSQSQSHYRICSPSNN
jgi:hypothetical protein